MTTKPVKVDIWALENARYVLTEQLQPRLATRITSPGVSSFIDEEFVARFGAGLHRLTDHRITTLALELLATYVSEHEPPNTGLPWIDDEQADFPASPPLTKPSPNWAYRAALFQWRFKGRRGPNVGPHRGLRTKHMYFNKLLREFGDPYGN